MIWEHVEALLPVLELTAFDNLKLVMALQTDDETLVKDTNHDEPAEEHRSL